MKGSRQDTFLADHICDIEAMRSGRAAGVSEDDPVVFRRELRKCLSYANLDLGQIEQRLRSGGGAWALFAPDPEDEVFKILEHQIDQVVAGGRIRMAVYFFMHLPIVKALKRARARGVTVDLLIDDDIQNGSPKSGQLRFYEAYLAPKESQFNLRMFDTNEAIYQMQHHKYLVLEGVGTLGRTRVFAGAGQFTLAAFQRNFENFYLIERPDVVSQFAKLYEGLWQKATPVAR